MRNLDSTLSRRSLLGAILATGALAAVGCSPSPTGNQEGAESQPTKPSGASPQPVAMTVYRDPSCGCCEAWAEIARNAGYEVKLIDHPDMAAIKRQYGVPEQLLSCHTTVVGNYVVEGHVPLEDVESLLSEGPKDIRGIAVAGMPIGSPGMEVPDGRTEPFQVMAFNNAGEVSVFRG